MDAILITAWDALVNMFLPIFTQPTALYFHTPADRLDSLRRPTHGHRHDPRWRSGRAPGTRCVSSFLPRCGLGYAGPLATVGSGAGPTFLSTGYGGRRLGRHLVSSVRQKGQGCRLVARCGPFDRRHHRLCLGSQYRGVDAARSSALGWRTVGLAHQHALASQTGAHPNRAGRADVATVEANGCRKGDFGPVPTGFTPAWPAKTLRPFISSAACDAMR